MEGDVVVVVVIVVGRIEGESVEIDAPKTGFEGVGILSLSLLVLLLLFLLLSL